MTTHQNGLIYSPALSPFERMRFVENLHDNYTKYEKAELKEILFKIVRLDNNVVVQHEAVFLFGMLHDHLIAFEDEIAKELIAIGQGTSSIVLYHEIVETLGFFANDLALEFVNKSFESADMDILDTAKISSGRQEYLENLINRYI